jgi:hypothetical protein
MTRGKIVVATIALAGLGAASPALAQPWRGADPTLRLLEVDVPAGALPPGPAVAELAGAGGQYRVRFAMPAAGPARVRLLYEYRLFSTGEATSDVVVRSDAGATYRTHVDPSEHAEAGAPLFLGSASDLATLSGVLAGSSEDTEVVTGIQLGAASEIAAPDCRRLAHARFVAVVLRGAEPVARLLTCVARGANVLIIGRRSGDDARPFARLGAGQAVVPWGLGRVVWLPDMASGVAAAVEKLSDVEQDEVFDSIVSGSNGAIGSVDDFKPGGVPGSGLVLALLALYVAVIGPVGYFVGVRPRRAWLAWSWFPMVALGATVALAAASTLWRGKPAELVLSRVSLVSPAGAGLETAGLRLQGDGARRYAVSLPWNDGDLRNVDRGYRFGTPFAAPSGSLAFTDDRIAGRLVADGLAVGRYGNAGFSWVTPAEHRAVEVTRRGATLVIANRTELPLRHVVARSADLCGAVDELPAGAERAVTPGACDQVKKATGSVHDRWPFSVLTDMDEAKAPAGAFLLVAEGEPRPPAVEVRPATKLTTREILVVRGPLAGGERAP